VIVRPEAEKVQDSPVAAGAETRTVIVVPRASRIWLAIVRCQMSS
jgi:hypothetical protein